jgi:hypothetical protein
VTIWKADADSNVSSAWHWVSRNQSTRLVGQGGCSMLSFPRSRYSDHANATQATAQLVVMTMRRRTLNGKGMATWQPTVHRVQLLPTALSANHRLPQSRGAVGFGQVQPCRADFIRVKMGTCVEQRLNMVFEPSARGQEERRVARAVADMDRRALSEEVVQNRDVGRRCCKVLCAVSNVRNLASFLQRTFMVPWPSAVVGLDR